jgi:hypothetical protein
MKSVKERRMGSKRVMRQPKVLSTSSSPSFNRRGGRGGSLYAPGGVHIYKNATRATNGPLVGFVIRKMPLKATNGPKILSYEPYVS